MPVPLMPALVFTPGRMLAGATPLWAMPVPLTCAGLGEGPMPFLGVAPLVALLGFAKIIGLFVRGTVPETAPGELGPMDRGVGAARTGSLTWGGLLRALGARPLPGCTGTTCGPLFSAGFLGAENGFATPLRALGPLVVALDVGAGCAAIPAIVEIPPAMRITSTYLAAHALEGPTCRRMALLQRSAPTKG